MTPETFVTTLKEVVKKCAEREVEYYAKPESMDPPKHLARFSAWYKGLSLSQQEIAGEAIVFAAEGSLFTLLTYLDNIALLTEEGGSFELSYISRDGKRMRLNDPDGPLLNELFNET